MSIRVGTSEGGVSLVYRPHWDPPSVEVQVSLSGVGSNWALPVEDLVKLFDCGDTFSTIAGLEALRQAIDERLAALDA